MSIFFEPATLLKIGEERCAKVDDNAVIHRYLYPNDLILNKTHAELKVNFLEYERSGPKQKKTLKFSWVTYIILNEESVQIINAGRLRWRIENDTFNTLKN